MLGLTHTPFPILIIRILATIYLSIGAGLLFGGSYYKQELAKLVDNFAFLLIDGIFRIIIGYLAIEYQTLWGEKWQLLTSLVGWVSLLSGVLMLTFPKFMHIFKFLLKREKIYIFLTQGVLLVGIILTYFGFFA